jgi:hypothetical protein
MKEIEEGNKLIAEFMGWDGIRFLIPPDYTLQDIEGVESMFYDFSENEMEYHSSWDWLMPVVEKIESKIFDNDEFYNFNILGGCCVIVISSHGNELITSEDGQSKIECTYLAVVEFIKWYNKQNV